MTRILLCKLQYVRLMLLLAIMYKLLQAQFDTADAEHSYKAQRNFIKFENLMRTNPMNKCATFYKVTLRRFLKISFFVVAYIN